MTFEELEDLFLALEINLNPSTFHGLLCGQLCWNDEKIDSFMSESADIFSISSDRGMDADQALRELYDEIYLNLKNSNFSFQPILPCDEAPLSERLGSFGYWCSNFVSGLADGITDQFSFTQESKEAISDLSAMGQVSDESNEDDDDERLYYELLEHARLSVQIIFSEINTSINEPLS